MSDDFFSLQKRGGVITSKVENQDSVGIILAVELLQSKSRYSEYINEVDRWNIMFESNDDLELIFSNTRVFVQVKSSEVTKGDLLSILDNFRNTLQYCRENELCKNVLFRINALDGFAGAVKSFKQKLDELHNCKKVYAEKEVDLHLKELLKQYNIDYKYAEVIQRLDVDTRALYKDEINTLSTFAHILRQGYAIRDFGDKLIKNFYLDLSEKFAYLRRNRKSISQKDFLSMIHSNINISNTVNFDTIIVAFGYKLSEIGYEKTNDLNQIQYQIRREQKKIHKNIMRGWRKAYLKEFLISCFLGSCKCPICGHALSANIIGLNGIACPRCSFQPYATLFLGCSCGNYKVIKKQPALLSDEFMNLVRDYFQSNSSLCNKCGREMLDEFWKCRLMVLPVPFPFKNYNLKELYYKNKK